MSTLEEQIKRIADAAFYRRYSSAFFTWSIASTFIAGSVMINRPRFVQHVMDEYSQAWGVFASDLGLDGMRDVGIPFTS